MKKNQTIIAVMMAAVLTAGILTGCSTSSGKSASEPAASSVAGAETSKEAVSGSTGNTKWPGGSVQLLVPSKAGGITDIYTRNVQNYLQQSTSGNFATVNYDTEAVAYENLRSAKTDGSSLLFQHTTLICKYLTGAVDYNPTEAFRVVGAVANMGSQAIICSPDAPYDTWEEFIAYCKEHPGEVNTGISTNGTTHFIFGQVEQNCGIKLNMVECSAEADKLTNVAGGIIDVANCSLGNAKEYEAAGKLKVLGVLGTGEAEVNYPEWQPIKDVIWVTYIYCFAPASMDDDTAMAVNEALKGLTADETYVAACESIGGAATWLSLEDSQKDFDDTMTALSDVATALEINVRN